MAEPYTLQLHDLTLIIDPALGHIAVEHDGDISWDDLQSVKNAIWGAEARAIEVYPRQSDVVNARPCRHLWRLGDNDFCPDLLGPRAYDDRLQSRFVRAWTKAGEA